MRYTFVWMLSACLVLSACSGSVGTSAADGGASQDALAADTAPVFEDGAPVIPDAAPAPDTAAPDPCAKDPDKNKNTFQWVLGAWSSCSTTCGQGSRTRTVTCEACDGKPAAVASCPQPAPPSSATCAATAGCTYAWKTGTWGACSKPCGGGTLTRAVWCERSDGVKVADAKCGGGAPVATNTCNAQGCNTTACAEMQAWVQCATAGYVNGIHGDATSTVTCRASCGAKSARCAKWINYNNSSVCVCHKVGGVQTSTSPFKKGNSSGYTIFAADCPATGPASKLSCKGAGCQTTCGTMASWQQCTGAAYFTDAIHGSNKSPAECAKSCGKMGAACAKYLKMANGGKSCVCHASGGVAASTDNYAKGNPQGLQIFSATCP